MELDKLRPLQIVTYVGGNVLRVRNTKTPTGRVGAAPTRLVGTAPTSPVGVTYYSKSRTTIFLLEKDALAATFTNPLSLLVSCLTKD